MKDIMKEHILPEVDGEESFFYFDEESGEIIIYQRMIEDCKPDVVLLTIEQQQVLYRAMTKRIMERMTKKGAKDHE